MGDGQDVPVREYGAMVGIATSNEIPDFHHATCESQYRQLAEVLDICGDAHVIEPFSVHLSNVDLLRRFRSVGWHVKFVSSNFDTLHAFFGCRREHVPDTITLDFIQTLIVRYAAQQSEVDDYED